MQLTTLRDRCDKFSQEVKESDNQTIDPFHVESFTLGVVDYILDEVLSGIQRERKYHDSIDEKFAEMRSPQLACSEIAGYVRALKSGLTGSSM